ncbi:MAG: exosortase A [Desulfuromonadales bacterium]
MTFLATLQRYRFYFGAVLLLLVAVYWRIVPSMVRQWYSDENYSHGFLVPIIAGYFLWQRWPDLKGRLVKPDGLGLIVIIWGLVQLLIAWLGVEYFTMRSSLIVLLAGMTLFWFGREVLKGMALPLGYLIFMIPIPYIIYDMAAFPLKLFVTRVSVAFMKIVGVVVMREGNIIMFPTTTLEVADACSGIRSLISLLAIAVAYSFVMKTSPLRRWIIICSAVPIAVATNSLRVIVTGILAQWWGARAAEGFFHEFAGMAVFVLAMVMLVAFGAAVKGGKGETGKQACGETASPEVFSSSHLHIDASPAVTPLSLHPLYRFITVFALLTVAALIITFHKDMDVPTNRPFSQFPQQVQAWKMSSRSEFSADVLQALKPTDYLYHQYKDAAGQTVSLYVGYHGGGEGGGEIHSPKHCLPGSGWYEVSTRQGVLDTPGGSINIVRAVYQKGESKELFLYWFQVRDRSITNEYSLKIAEIMNSALYRRRDASFIRVSVQVDANIDQATARGEQFIRDFEPLFREFLPR